MVSLLTRRLPRPPLQRRGTKRCAMPMRRSADTSTVREADDSADKLTNLIGCTVLLQCLLCQFCTLLCLELVRLLSYCDHRRSRRAAAR